MNCIQSSVGSSLPGRTRIRGRTRFRGRGRARGRGRVRGRPREGHEISRRRNSVRARDSPVPCVFSRCICFVEFVPPPSPSAGVEISRTSSRAPET